MSDQAEQNARFVTCPCQHCNGGIEFDANELDSPIGVKAPCPHCGKQTWLFEPDAKPSQNTATWAIAIGILAMLILIGLCAYFSAKDNGGSPPLWGLAIYSVFSLGMIAALAGLYFLPTIIAYKRKKVNTMAISMLNLFLGWTLIGWIVALIWAVAQDDHI